MEIRNTSQSCVIRENTIGCVSDIYKYMTHVVELSGNDKKRRFSCRTSWSYAQRG